MKILITGGGGYLGSVLLRNLSPFRDYSITVVDKFDWGYGAISSGWDHPRVEFVNADLIMGFDYSSYDVIINLAAIAGETLARKEPERSYAVNCRLPLIIAASLKPKQRMIHISTTAVYGDMKGQIAYEGSPVNLARLGIYGRAKALADKSLSNYPRVAIVRLATLYGISPVMRPHMLIHEMVKMAVKVRSVMIYGKTNALRPIIHVSDAACKIAKMINKIDDYIGKITLLATENISKSAIVTVISRQIGADIFSSDLKDLALQDHTVRTSPGLVLANEIVPLAEYYKVVP